MTIRALCKTDIPFLVSARDSFPDAWDEKMLLSAFNAGNFFGFIAEDGAPAGFITYSVNIDTADMQDLFVAENYRRKGVGNALITKFIDNARACGLKKLFLEVRESNTPAINLYKKAEFNLIATRKKYYSDGENALVLVKEL
ncbi:MAG: ribosomal protein S18-alanine N-acetyltransferase [Clostridia bacterium]|nr:ribosomal protein S18-alanine N-acetyltransferase [Clostridia bacterium]